MSLALWTDDEAETWWKENTPNTALRTGCRAGAVGKQGLRRPGPFR